MKRLEKYRSLRIARKKCIFISLLCFIIIITGILTVDYSINALMNGENGIKLFAVKKTGDGCYLIKIFNKDLYLNINYIKEDFNKLLEWLNISCSLVICYAIIVCRYLKF
ncbi:MAG TPA: hypothetical protein DCE02_06620 [Ruminiclostridium sp.]|nr:hypothetical protein [Ruminiclostridium sp.]